MDSRAAGLGESWSYSENIPPPIAADVPPEVSFCRISFCCFGRYWSVRFTHHYQNRWCTECTLPQKECHPECRHQLELLQFSIPREKDGLAMLVEFDLQPPLFSVHDLGHRSCAKNSMPNPQPFGDITYVKDFAGSPLG